MPSHEWACSKCKKVTAVIRKAGEHHKEPSKDERKCKCKNNKWTKTFTSAPKAAYGNNWGGGKGNWVILLGLLLWNVIENTYV